MKRSDQIVTFELSCAYICAVLCAVVNFASGQWILGGFISLVAGFIGARLIRRVQKRDELSWEDYRWVLQAYVRGKILQQSDYRPHFGARGVRHNIHDISVVASDHRKRMLLKWWGLYYFK